MRLPGRYSCRGGHAAMTARTAFRFGDSSEPLRIGSVHGRATKEGASRQRARPAQPIEHAIQGRLSRKAHLLT
jgi:hypothetical protein